MVDTQSLQQQIRLLFDVYQQALTPAVRHIENGHDVTYLFDRMYTIPRYAATAAEIAQADAHPDDSWVTVEDVHDDDAANIDDYMREFTATLRREWRRIKGRDCPFTLYRSRQELLTCLKLSQFASFRDRERIQLDLMDMRDEILAAIDAADENLPTLCFETDGQVRRTDLDPIREVQLSPTQFHLLQFIYDNKQVTKQELTDEFRRFRNQKNKMDSINIESNRDTHFTNIGKRLKKEKLEFNIKTKNEVHFIVREE